MNLTASVKNTMSGHCTTNGAFNMLLDNLRKVVLPQIVNSWKTLTKPEKEKLSEMGNFFCKAHPLVSFAEAANKAIPKF